MNRCKYCDTKMKVLKSYKGEYFGRIITMEEHLRCPNCNYEISFSYGLTEVLNESDLTKEGMDHD